MKTSASLLKGSDCVDHSKLWKILKEMRIPDHHTCLLRNLYAGQEATVRTKHATTEWFRNWKISMARHYIVTLLIYLTPWIYWNSGRVHHVKSWAGIKSARRNINNLRYADDTILKSQSEEELKTLVRVKEKSEKVGLKLNIQKTKITHLVPLLHGK